MPRRFEGERALAKIYGKRRITWYYVLTESAMSELFHVGLTVKNLERSLAFYRDVPGMMAGEIFDGHSQEFDTLTNNPAARRRGVHLKAGPFMGGVGQVVEKQ